MTLSMLFWRWAWTISTTITFNCTVSDDINLTNVTLYGDWNSWSAKQTNSSGINNTDYYFTVNLNSTGNYKWNCYACDNASQCSFGVANYTFSINFSKSGAINTTAGATPFWTNKSSNPYTINLTDGEWELVTFWVNATGAANSTHEFFAYANLTSNMDINDIVKIYNDQKK